jgi:anti-sigma regulatory factor (Ser/Thr protein kinase)
MLLDEWGLTHLDDRALLLASELVTNAVVHARETSILSVWVEAGALEVRVADPAAPFPRLRHPQPEDEAGRGLMLVNTFADSWGVEPSAREGKAVWFRLTC